VSIHPDEERRVQRAAHAERILRAAIDAADPAPHVRAAVHDARDVLSERRVHLLAIGKAAAVMAAAALEALARPPAATLVIVPHGTVSGTSDVLRILYASHPIPDRTSVQAATAVERMLDDVRADDVALVLLSGGASALCAAPADDISVDEYARIVSALMNSGADIRELNAVRSHIDRLKGGGMAEHIAPARAVAFVVSDVTGNALDVIASGPLTPPTATRADARRVLERHGLLETASTSVLSRLDDSDERQIANAFDHVSVRIIADNSTAIDGAAAEADRLGYDVQVVAEPVTGQARAAGRRIAVDALRLAQRPRSRAACLLYGGETTVIVTGAGKGGRNQELVLAAAIELDGHSCVTIGSVGTDGVDGPTDAAGAVADGATVMAVSRAGLDVNAALEQNDSHAALGAVGALIRTGATGTNVMDVQVVLIDRV
jgi:glycerate 2-kinase